MATTFVSNITVARATRASPPPAPMSPNILARAVNSATMRLLFPSTATAMPHQTTQRRLLTLRMQQALALNGDVLGGAHRYLRVIRSAHTGPVKGNVIFLWKYGYLLEASAWTTSSVRPVDCGDRCRRHCTLYPILHRTELRLASVPCILCVLSFPYVFPTLGHSPPLDSPGSFTLWKCVGGWCAVSSACVVLLFMGTVDGAITMVRYRVRCCHRHRLSLNERLLDFVCLSRN